MDPEPWRCRRTDGKKWRCYRKVLFEQKYCEKHMHRGRRSRKHVEATEEIQKSSYTHINPDKSRSSTVSLNSAIADSRISAFVSTKLDLTIPSPDVTKKIPAAVKVGSDSFCRNRNNVGKGTDIVQITKPSSSLLRDLTNKNNSRCCDNFTDDKDFSLNRSCTSKFDWRYQGNKTCGDTSFVPGFGSSPKSVLHGGFGIGRSILSCESKTELEIEAELSRCKRTDGRKWRCSRDVVPDKKYCENHLHRGTKKPILISNSETAAPVCFSSSSLGVTSNGTRVVEDCVNLNTNLTIGIASSPQQQQQQQQISDPDPCSTSSDATTETDETVCISSFFTLSDH